MPTEPGPELDAAVDERFFGQRWVCHPKVCINGTWYEVPTWLWEGADPADPTKGICAGNLPPPRSSDISAAWEVVEKLLDTSGDDEWICVRIENDGPEWECTIFDDPLCIIGDARAPSAPHAICLAALETVKEEP